MLNKFIVLIALLIIVLNTHAAKFSGTVTDTDGEAVEGVEVFFLYLNESVYTNNSGQWEFTTDESADQTIVFGKSGYAYEQVIDENANTAILTQLRIAPKSYASIREVDYIKHGCDIVTIPNSTKWNANFEETTLKGDLAPDSMFTRRDPSAVIKVDDTYYIWYSYSLTHDTKKLAPWDLNDIYYSSSKDGITWTEQGIAVGRGEAGSFDHRSVFTTEIFAENGKYYLVYQAAEDEDGIYNRNVVGMSTADSPNGPWTKLQEPVLRPTYTNHLFFDNNAVHDPCIIAYNGKYYLYYKGECNCRDNVDCDRWCNPICGYNKQVKWGVAIADTPTGPFVKSASNPITNTGHEVMVWPYENGVAILQHQDGPEAMTIQFANDGINFEIMGAVTGIPEAAGLFRSAHSDTDPHAGVSWGVAHKLKWNAGPKGWMYIHRFGLVKDARPKPSFKGAIIH